MSLPKRNSRPLTIGAEKYRWAVISQWRDAAYGFMTFLVHRDAKKPGQALRINLEGQIVVTPGLVAFMVEHFRQNGWVPDKGGMLDIGPHRSRRLWLAYEAQQRALQPV